MVDTPQEPLPKQPSVAQFGLRGLAITVTVVAVLSAVVAPWVRSMDADAQQDFAIRLSLFGLGFCVSLIWDSLQRYRMERRAGHRYLSFANPGRRGRPWISSLMTIIAIVVIIFAIKDFQALALLLGMNAASPTTRLWWNREGQGHELCENGILCGNRLTPWTKYRAYNWGKNECELRLYQKFQIDHLIVPFELRHQTDAIVRKFLPHK